VIDVETRVEIARPVQDVFAFVADQTNAPQWQTDLHEVRRLTDGPIGVGSEHEVVRAFAGRRIASRNRFVAFEPGRYVKFEIPSGGSQAQRPIGPRPARPRERCSPAGWSFASEVRCRCWSPSSPDSWPRTHDATSSGSRVFWSKAPLPHERSHLPGDACFVRPPSAAWARICRRQRALRPSGTAAIRSTARRVSCGSLCLIRPHVRWRAWCPDRFLPRVSETGGGS